MMDLETARKEAAHKWVTEQAELGEKTDNVQGLSEFRIDAAIQAFEAGWRAGIALALTDVDRRVTKLEERIAADTQRKQIPV